MFMNRAWIEERIPHHGRMCLLDEVIEWDAQHIRCRSATHRDPDNPLRSHGRLGIACGIEYAAQAMALHGALAAHGTLAAAAPSGGPTRRLVFSPAFAMCACMGFTARRHRIRFDLRGHPGGR